MQAVRCESCGHKALVAASQCPKCSHPIDIRDSFGELLPLSYCSSCDASYPSREGACRWCGSTPARANLRNQVLKGVGALAFAAMAVGAWYARDAGTAHTSAASAEGATVGSGDRILAVATGVVEDRPDELPGPAMAIGDLPADSARVVTMTPADTGGLPATNVAAEVAAAPTSSLAGGTPDVTLPVLSSLPEPGVDGGGASRVEASEEVILPRRRAAPTGPQPSERVPGRAEGGEDEATAAVPTPPRPRPRSPGGAAAVKPVPTVPRTAPKAVPRSGKDKASRRVLPWSTVVVASWVTVRSSPTAGARVVGSVGPDSRVQLGEARGEWRRLRMRGLTGWVHGGRYKTPQRNYVVRRGTP